MYQDLREYKYIAMHISWGTGRLCGHVDRPERKKRLPSPRTDVSIVTEVETDGFLGQDGISVKERDVGSPEFPW